MPLKAMPSAKVVSSEPSCASETSKVRTPVPIPRPLTRVYSAPEGFWSAVTPCAS